MNENQFKLLILKKAETYYFTLANNSYYSNWYKEYEFDGIKAIDTYVNNWCKLNFLPKVIKKIIPGRSEVIKYILEDEYIPTEKMPKEVSVEFFELDEEEERKHNNLYALYFPIYTRTPEIKEEIDFILDIIDLDAEPIGKTKYPFESEFPYKIDIHPDILYKYPCHITGIQLFKIIKEVVNKNLTSNCGIEYNYDDYVKVNLIIPVIHKEIVTNTYTKIFNKSKRDKIITESKPLRAINFPIIDISSPKDTIWKKTRIETIYASNYFELEKKIDDILTNYLALMNQKLIVCEHCKGYGYIKEGKE